METGGMGAADICCEAGEKAKGASGSMWMCGVPRPRRTSMKSSRLFGC